MKIYAIDPGTEKSACVAWDGAAVLGCDYLTNENMLEHVGVAGAWHHPDSLERLLVIENIESFGMAVGKETFETVHWAGRFHQIWVEKASGEGGEVALVGRKAVKLHLCGSMKAKDGNIRQALIDRFGKVGTVKNPGPLFGISSHLWAALALAVTYYDQNNTEGLPR